MSLGTSLAKAIASTRRLAGQVKEAASYGPDDELAEALKRLHRFEVAQFKRQRAACLPKRSLDVQAGGK